MKDPLVLALETSTRRGSVALRLRNREVTERILDEGAMQGRLLAPAVASMLSEQHLNPQDLDLVAVGLGPGSYTGLRVGIALARGFAFGNNCALKGVSSFAAMALGRGAEGEEILTIGKGGSNDYAFALFCIRQGLPSMMMDHAMAGKETILPLRTPHRTVAGEGASELWDDAPQVIPCARDVAALATTLYLKEGATPEEEVLPLYLRRSTAEINWEKRGGT
jgi:tRNA threonylcarbamoyladenosine biosynthesis protein TsaB